jgi:hypothetical protein
MEETRRLGLIGGMMALALLLGGCGVHAGISIGKSSTPPTVHGSNSAVAQSQMSEAPQ